MDQPRFAELTRRRLIARAGSLAVAAAAAQPFSVLSRGAFPAAVPDTPESASAPAVVMPLIDAVSAVCQRLAPAGWRDLLLQVTDDDLDIVANDLRAELDKPLPLVDRGVPGFEDFALEGMRGIEPGVPARSLLFHALASPNVFQDGAGGDLSAFPTPAELEAVENYVYGANPPPLAELRARASGDPLAIAVFALEYRPGSQTVHGQHADVCFSRTGHARMGTTEAVYDDRRREFLPTKADDPFAFPVQPVRYAAFVAVQRYGNPGAFGPLRATDDDADRQFWVPLHKLFSGPECIRGLDLTVDLTTGHINEKLRRFHLRMSNAGFYTGWGEPDIDRFPFVIEGESLATLSADPSLGSGWVMPQPHPFVEAAEYDGRPLTFFYSAELAATPTGMFYSTLQVLEAPPFNPLGPERTQSLPENRIGPGESIPTYLTIINPDVGRSGPEYLNIRRKIAADGAEVNLNDLPDVLAPIAEGGYWTRHYVDYAGDGWVAARCTQLDVEIPARIPAYSTVTPPSFYPYTSQRELTEWAESEAPAELRDGIWAVPPRPLSDRRLAANIHLAAGFSIDDDTVTAIVSHPMDTVPEQSGSPVAFVRRPLHLPDSAAGLFDPGWDVSQDRTEDNRFFLANYGLGTPFIEDVKICAALSAFWPGVSPDIAREFQPASHLRDKFQAWPTIAPMTDEELGIVAIDGRGFLPWDGVRGPHLTSVEGRDVVDYPDIYHTDYLETVDHITAALTGAVDQHEYTARVLAMAQVYWALGVRYDDFGARYALSEALDRFQATKAEWAVLSFRALGEEPEDDLRRAEAATGTRLDPSGPDSRRYRFHLFQWDGEEIKPHDVRRVLIGMREQIVVYTDLTTLFLSRDGATWESHQPPR